MQMRCHNILNMQQAIFPIARSKIVKEMDQSMEQFMEWWIKWWISHWMMDLLRLIKWLIGHRTMRLMDAQCTTKSSTSSPSPHAGWSSTSACCTINYSGYILHRPNQVISYWLTSTTTQVNSCLSAAQARDHLHTQDNQHFLVRKSP